MKKFLGIAAVLVVGLAVAGLTTEVALESTLREWAESDLHLRSQLAVMSAVPGFRAGLAGKSEVLLESLENITRDERILATAFCDEAGRVVAKTSWFPDGIKCPPRAASAGEGRAYRMFDAGDGAQQLSVVPLVLEGGERGTVLVLHDFGFLNTRSAFTRRTLFGMFALVVGFALIVVVIGVRFVRRGWLSELRSALAGSERDEFAPLLRDVRALSQRLAEESSSKSLAGSWGPERLRATLATLLDGERIVVLANREPYVHERVGEKIVVHHPASGLVTALEPVLRACSGTWVGHGSGSADRVTVDARDRVRVPPGAESYSIRRVWLQEAEEDGYYYGFSNEGLWPLCHIAHMRPRFRAADFEAYRAVNRKFADAVCEEVEGEDPVILVQDYHFALAPRMIRERLPKATILTFWHIPWPNAERFGICPYREEILDGLLGSSILGFHTQQHCGNFVDSVDAFMESRIDRESTLVSQGDHKTAIRAYPISIEWPVRWLDGCKDVSSTRNSMRKRLGLAKDTLIGMGVDRLDYTKGIEERILAVEEFLGRFPEYRGRFVFVQLAAPSRTKIQNYRELNERVEVLVERVNRELGSPDYKPIVLLREHHEPGDVFDFYRAADFVYVSSLHDGMNLVAKEFVAARDDEAGVLILSQFTGAARDLNEALIVNPYDLAEAASAMARALGMSRSEQRERMRSMRRLVSEFNVFRWAGKMLIDAAEVRRRERFSGRFDHGRRLAGSGFA